MNDQPPKHSDTIWGKLKGGWTIILGILGVASFIAVIILLPGLFIGGVLWIAEIAYPWLVDLSVFAVGVCAIIFLPLAIFRRTRTFAGWGLSIASWVFGITLWCWGLLLTYDIWGIFAVIIGLIFLGVGVLPIAMLATLFNGLWPSLAVLVVLTALTFGARLTGAFVLAKAESAN